MPTIVQELLKVCEIDRELISLKKQIEAGPKEIKEQEEKIAEVREARRQAETTIKTKAAELDQCNLDIRTAESELVNQENKVSSIKNNKEYKIVTDRIKALKNEIGELETQSLQKMEELDSFKTDLKEKLSVVGGAEERIASLRAEIEKEAVEIKARAQKLKALRDPQLKVLFDLDPTVLEAYKLAFRRGHGEAMAEMVNGTCQACFRNASPNIANIVLVGKDIKRCACAGCGRLLYVSTPYEAPQES